MTYNCEQLMALIEAQMAMIKEASALLEQGLLPDISPIKQQTAAICAAMQELEDNEAKQLEVPVATLIGALEDMVGALNIYKERLVQSQEE